MLFKTGMLYISVVMQILLSVLGQDPNDIKDQIELSPSDLQEMLALDSEIEALRATPQMLGTIVQRQSNFPQYPQITGYQLTPSNIIVYYDTSFFEQEVDASYYYPDEPTFYDENGDIVFQEDDYYYEDYYYEEPILDFIPLYKTEDSNTQKNYQR